MTDNYYNPTLPYKSSGFSGSAILLEGSANLLAFLGGGFMPAPSVAAGCLINDTSPSPCFAYADNLNTSEIYYLYGVIR